MRIQTEHARLGQLRREHRIGLRVVGQDAHVQPIALVARTPMRDFMQRHGDQHVAGLGGLSICHGAISVAV